MRKKDDKVGNKTHGYTKEKAGKGKKEREKAYVERSKYGRPKKKKKKKEVVSLHPISRRKYSLIIANEGVCLSYINSIFF